MSYQYQPESLATDVAALLQDLRKRGSSGYGNPTANLRYLDAATVIEQAMAEAERAHALAVPAVQGEPEIKTVARALHNAHAAWYPHDPATGIGPAGPGQPVWMHLAEAVMPFLAAPAVQGVTANRAESIKGVRDRMLAYPGASPFLVDESLAGVVPQVWDAVFGLPVEADKPMPEANPRAIAVKWLQINESQRQHILRELGLRSMEKVEALRVIHERGLTDALVAKLPADQRGGETE